MTLREFERLSNFFASNRAAEAYVTLGLSKDLKNISIEFPDFKFKYTDIRIGLSQEKDWKNSLMVGETYPLFSCRFENILVPEGFYPSTSLRFNTTEDWNKQWKPFMKNAAQRFVYRDLGFEDLLHKSKSLRKGSSFYILKKNGFFEGREKELREQYISIIKETADFLYYKNLPWLSCGSCGVNYQFPGTRDFKFPECHHCKGYEHLI